jgi:hypothetical protein
MPALDLADSGRICACLCSNARGAGMDHRQSYLDGVEEREEGSRRARFAQRLGGQAPAHQEHMQGARRGQPYMNVFSLCRMRSLLSVGTSLVRV